MQTDNHILGELEGFASLTGYERSLALMLLQAANSGGPGNLEFYYVDAFVAAAKKFNSTLSLSGKTELGAILTKLGLSILQPNSAALRSLLRSRGCLHDAVLKSKCHAGAVEVKMHYFYHHGWDAQKWGQHVIKSLPGNFELVAVRDDWRAWPKDSYLVAVVREKAVS